MVSASCWFGQVTHRRTPTPSYARLWWPLKQHRQHDSKLGASLNASVKSRRVYASFGANLLLSSAPAASTQQGLEEHVLTRGSFGTHDLCMRSEHTLAAPHPVSLAVSQRNCMRSAHTCSAHTCSAQKLSGLQVAALVAGPACTQHSNLLSCSRQHLQQSMHALSTAASALAAAAVRVTALLGLPGCLYCCMLQVVLHAVDTLVANSSNNVLRNGFEKVRKQTAPVFRQSALFAP